MDKEEYKDSVEALKFIDSTDEAAFEIEKKYFKDYTTALYITAWLVERIIFNSPTNSKGEKADVFSDIKEVSKSIQELKKEYEESQKNDGDCPKNVISLMPFIWGKNNNE